MTAGWSDLERELDRWAAAGLTATLWWRDDDAVEPTPGLDTLLGLAAAHRVPLVLAVIPAAASRDLAGRVLAAPAVAVAQHGYRHRNHAPAGEKKAELGDHRAAAAIGAELAAGFERLEELFGARLLPALVPPWNRIGAEASGHVGGWGYSALSTFGPRPAAALAGVACVNTHVDPIDWRGSRAFRGEAAVLAQAVDRLAGRRTGSEDRDEPTGLLTHHLVHDAACWDFVDAFLARTAAHPAVRWLDGASAFSIA